MQTDIGCSYQIHLGGCQMNRSTSHFLVRVILLCTIFISSLPTYVALAGYQISEDDGQDNEGDLTVEVLSGSPLDEFPPEEAFMLLFSEPMQVESSNQPLTITPFLEGEITWGDDAKHLTFVPEGGFATDQNYTFSLDLNLTSRSGKQFHEPQTWAIHTLAGPRLTSRNPNNVYISDRFPIIQLTFDSIMDPNSVIEGIHVEPEIEMDFGWGGMDFFIRSLTELDPDDIYHFTLSQEAKDIHGLSLQSSYSWTYTLEPVIRSITYPTNEKRQWFIGVEFNYGVEWESLDGNLTIEPAIAGRWIQEKDDGTRIKFIPEGHFQSDVLYTIRFNGTLLDLRGSELPAPEPISFRSPSALRQTSPGQGDVGDPPHDIILNFDRPMDKYATEAALSFQPPLEGEFHWEDYGYEEDEDFSEETPLDISHDAKMGAAMIFVPNLDLFSWGTEYTGTLDVSAKDAEGNPILQEPYQWSFQIGAPEEAYDGCFGYYGANIQILDIDGPRAIQYELGMSELREIEFSLHPLTQAQFLERFETSADRKGWGNPPKIDLDGTEQIQRWTVQVQGIREDVGEVRLSYDIPAGFYILNLIDGRFDFIVDQLFVVLSKNTLVVKQADGQIVTWTTDIHGGPRQGVLVQIYDKEGEIIDRGHTDTIGVYRSHFSTDHTPYLVIAKDGNDLSLSGLDKNWGERKSYWEWRRIEDQDSIDYGIIIYTDRPIYRPGQSVFFKAIVRQDEDAIISMPYQDTPVSARIIDPRNNTVQSYELSTNNFGTVHGEFSLSDGAMIGDYMIEVESLGKLVTQEFKVQDYKKPDIQITLETDADEYVVGEDIQLSLEANYLFGESVREANVYIWTYDLIPSNWWYSGMGEENDQYVWTSGRKVHDGVLTIENGFLKHSIPAQIEDYDRPITYRSNLKQRIVAIETTIEDGSGQSISTYKIVKIFNTDVELQLDLGECFKHPDQSFIITASVSNISEDPLIAYPLQLTIMRYGSETREHDQEILNTDLITGDDGMASQITSLKETGVYKFELTGIDDNGNETYYRRWAYVYEGNDPWLSDLSEEIRILADKTTYSAGETAHLLIESTFDGEALLTVERGTTRRVKQLYLTSPVTNVDLEILESDQPNIFVSINAYKDEISTIAEMPPLGEYWFIQSLVESQLNQDTIELAVPPTSKALNIKITPDQDIFAPREEATFTIEVTDSWGNPVSAELSLALVDEAIFSLSEDLSVPLLDAFYAPRENGVQTYDSMGARRWIQTYQAGGGGGGGPDLPGTPRSDFPDTAAWIPALWTDSAGKAKITISLPDTLTTWRLTAKAVTTDTKVGEMEITILTKQNVVIRPLVPRGLTEGDLVTLSAVVQNYDESEREFDVLLMNTSLEILDPALQSTSIKPGEDEKVSWSVRADKPGEAVITIVADDGDIGDAVQVTIPVQQRSIPDLITESGDFQGQLSTTVRIPEENLSQSWVQIDLNRSIAGSLLTGLEYLTDFPYGCVEQTMSRALPNAMVARAFYQLGVGTKTELADLSEKINAGLQRLYGYQHLDGGWGWWHDDDSYAYETAWVVYGLAMTAEAGYEVDPNVIKRGVAWLEDNLDEMDDQLKSYALYSMAIAGYGDRSETNALASNMDGLDTFSIAALALALHELEEYETALRLVNALESTAVVGENAVHWPILHQNDTYRRRTMASEIRDTALALSAFVKITPNHAYESRIVRWLMDQRGSHGWGNTHQNSYAILALTDQLLASGYS
jgi:hypothetical protein